MAKRTMGTIEDICSALHPGMRVFLHAGPAESLALRNALVRRPEKAEGVTFVGAFVPGVNDFDYASLTPTTRVVSCFLPHSARESAKLGRYSCLPVHYSAFAAYLEAYPADLSILHVPEDENGFHSFGLNADFAGTAVRTSRAVALIVNRRMPFTHGHRGVVAEEAAIIAEDHGELLSFPQEAGDRVSAAIAANVAPLIGDGDTVEIGLGKLPTAILRALKHHRNLRLYSGMMTDAFAELWHAGAVDMREKTQHRVGMAIGSEPIWELAGDSRIGFCGVEITHNPLLGSQAPNYVALNSAIEVDLFGQVNGEAVSCRPVSGTGGSADFIRSARMSEGGRSIIALPATAKGASRIVPLLGGFPVTQTRADADIVVTEYGCARLRYLTLDERAEALIAIADPVHRPELTDKWRELRRNF